jgi:hypothetical protein
MTGDADDAAAVGTKISPTAPAPLQRFEAVQPPPLHLVDGVDGFAHYNGIVHVALTQLRFGAVEEGRLHSEFVVVANLRMNLVAARNLREALDKALLMAAPKTEGAAH